MKNTGSQTYIKDVEEGAVIVLFAAPWSGPARMVGPKYEDAVYEHAKNVKLFYLNTDDHNAFATRNGIRSVPTAIFYFNGKEEQRVVGNPAGAEIVDLVVELGKKKNPKKGKVDVSVLEKEDKPEEKNNEKIQVSEDGPGEANGPSISEVIEKQALEMLAIARKISAEQTITLDNAITLLRISRR